MTPTSSLADEGNWTRVPLISHEAGRAGQVGHRIKIPLDGTQEKKLSLVPASKGADTMKNKTKQNPTTQTPVITSCKTGEKAARFF